MKLVHFLLDESGSMEAMRTEAITGYNGYLDSLASLSDVLLCLTKFDSAKVERLHAPLAPADALRLDDENYRPGASTPLYDAVAHVIRDSEGLAHDLPTTDVLVVILTDGHENASREYDVDKLNAYIKEHEEGWGWSFLYLGVGKEAWKNESAFVGTVAMDSGQTYRLAAGAPGLKASYAVAARATAAWASETGRSTEAKPAG